MSSKFAKKNTTETNDKPKGVIVDLDRKSPKMAHAGRAPITKTEREILEKAGVKPVKGGKVAKADKKAAKAPKADKAERVASDDKRKITNVAKENPHREGSGRHGAFEAARKAKTVADYLATGNKPKYLAGWEGAGLLKLS